MAFPSLRATMSATGGQISIVRGDIRRLACDAWCLPADGQGRVEPSWVAWPEGASAGLAEASAFPHWTREAHRSRPLEGWPAQLPEPWLLHVELDPQVPASWLIEAVLGFVSAASARLRGRPPRYQAEVPLLAIPIGVAGIGAADAQRASRMAGALARSLLPELKAAAIEARVDVALVAHTDQSFAALQAARSTPTSRAGGPSPSPAADGLQAVREATARRALVLVLGESVADRMGVPGWRRGLDQMAQASGLAVGLRQGLAALGEEDHTRWLLRRLGGSSAVATSLASSLNRPHYGLAHGLVAGLDPCLVVAHSSDDMAEQALSAAGRRVVAIGDEGGPADGTPFVRMSGSPRLPGSLVLSRVDTDWQRERESNLAAVAQVALPDQPHILVLGVASLPRLLRTLAALEPALTSRRHTGLTILAEPGLEASSALLPAATRFIPYDPGTGSDRSESARFARSQVRLLDELGQHAWHGRHCLDPSVRHLLDSGDLALARGVEDLLTTIPERARRGPAWTSLLRWLTAHGHPGRIEHPSGGGQPA